MFPPALSMWGLFLHGCSASGHREQAARAGIHTKSSVKHKASQEQGPFICCLQVYLLICFAFKRQREEGKGEDA